MKTIKYETSRMHNPVTGQPGYLIATLVIEEQPNFYPVHITAPDPDTWTMRAASIQRRYKVQIETMF